MLLEVRHGPKTPGLHAIVKHCTPTVATRNDILHISMNMLETKNLRYWMGGTFLAMSKEMVKDAANVGGCYPISPIRLKHRFASDGNSNF